MELNIFFVVIIIISSTQADNEVKQEERKSNSVCNKNDKNGKSCTVVDQLPLDFEKSNWQTDFVINVGGKKLYVSKSILALASPYFQRALEANEFKQSSMELDNIDIEDVREFLRCIYPNFLAPVTMKNVEKILPIADYFEVSQLIEKCDKILVEHVKFDADPERILDILKKAFTYNLHALGKRCLEVLGWHQRIDIISGLKKRNVTDCEKTKRFKQPVMPYKSSRESAKKFTPCSESLESVEDMIDTLVEGYGHIELDRYVGKSVKMRVINKNDFSVSQIVNFSDINSFNTTVFIRKEAKMLLPHQTLKMVITESKEIGGYMKAKVILDNGLSKPYIVYVKDINKEVEIASEYSLNENFPSEFDITIYILVRRP